MRDPLGALVLEWTLHALIWWRTWLLPPASAHVDDADALRIATGRRPATPAEQEELDALGPCGQMLPLSFG